MHERVMWFDTKGCTDGPIIGDGLDFTVTGDNGDWIRGRTGRDYQRYTTDQRTRYTADNKPLGERHDAWDQNIVVSGGRWGWKDLDVLERRYNAEYDLRSDCDLECQQRGSGLTMVAILMGAAYGLIGLNALFMFFGSFRPMCRLCSLYCTVFACMVQLAVQLACAAFLFSDYANLCSMSLNPTGNPRFTNGQYSLESGKSNTLWTMADDMFVARYLWGWGFVFMFGFCCCGLCNGFQFGQGGGNSIMVINKMLD